MRALVRTMFEKADASRRAGHWKLCADWICCALFVAASASGTAWFLSYVGALRIR